MKIIETIFDASTNETNVIERDMTSEELASWQAIQNEKIAYAEKQAEANTKRMAALAKLEAIGLDEDDLKALGL